MNTKAIARKTGIAISIINETARDLGIASYDYTNHCWRVQDSKAEAFIQHITKEA
ncbi:hypothetical protein FDJ44_gp28 [Microbacterium phage Pikmin]|uniref:Uncharacterized protein n=3 Tax=Pikminvirus pikmin TaxID=2560596 RepID=A0A2P1CKN1_9CAUD|nr:hypothetical protein FDJ44_gp28 [Microbacterium phage Pikmin]AVJ51019.1 hypothetical protein PBI_PAJAZA_28 [Microbacterium phage Pajaza]AVJ51166.1 hypothetical protein PBI_PIKMIN_28 [Microbacterium phage Pikmin]AVJ51724.1 hypothetical protein PBI_CASEY_28 [Microbacterium phage Casey]